MRDRGDEPGGISIMTHELDRKVRCALLGSFDISYGQEKINLPLGAQRLLGFLALQDGPVHRVAAAERLWPTCVSARASANLRSALWHVRRDVGATVIESAGSQLRLSPAVQVDQRSALLDVQAMTNSRASGAADLLSRHAEIIRALSQELLPDWSEDWLMLERERWDQVRLHALETFARQLMSSERYVPALEAALRAVSIEPIRESAHRTLIEIHLAEGNAACAVKHYQRYRGMLYRELGVAPSRRMARLIEALSTP
jgi:DNA-binding SARP family transcriptional activator